MLKRFPFLSISFLCLITAFLSIDRSYGDTHSKRPLPRFASIRSNEVRLRTGPGREYPIIWVVKYKDLPVKIIAEYQHWRQIALPDKTTGWVHQSLLSGKRTLLVTRDETKLLNREDSRAVPVARVYKNALFFFPKEKCAGSRCYVKAEQHKGWIEKQDVWGLLEHE